MSIVRKERDEMITISEASKDTGIPLTTFKSAIRAGRMWGEKRGRDWWTSRSEVARFQKMHTPHKLVKN